MKWSLGLGAALELLAAHAGQDNSLANEKIVAEQRDVVLRATDGRTVRISRWLARGKRRPRADRDGYA